MTSITRHLRISGRVQGVGYRYYMSRKARQIGITGWVRNRADGTVEAMVCGTPDLVASIVAWAHHGPARAGVAGVDIAEGSGEFAAFATLPTA